MKATHKFSQFTYWNLETPPSNNDAVVKAMQWINIASAVSVTVVGRDRRGGGAGRAIALPLYCWDLFSSASVNMEKFPWNYSTLPYERVGCFLVRTITTRFACKDNKMQGPNGAI